MMFEGQTKGVVFMKDVVFLKEERREDRLWENSPHLAFVGWILLTIVLMGATLVLGFICSQEALTNIFMAAEFIVGCAVIPVYKNEYRNLSKSIGFIKRDNKLYVIKLGYAANSRDPVYVQQAEKEIRERRKMEEVYIWALDECLKRLQAHPKQYYRPRKKGELKFHGAFDVDGVAGFLILEKPRIEKETEGYLWISYDDRHGGRTTIKFRNAYGKLKDEIEQQTRQNQ